MNETLNDPRENSTNERMSGYVRRGKEEEKLRHVEERTKKRRGMEVFKIPEGTTR